jgi:hypothetical protein
MWNSSLKLMSMIEVKWEYEGTYERPSVQAVVERVVRRLQHVLGDITCPVHGQIPGLQVRGHTLSTLDIGFVTCCQELLDEATNRIPDIRHRRGNRSRRKLTVPYVPDRRQLLR